MKKIDLGSENTLNTVLRLMIPAMLSQFSTVLYNIVDRMYIGNIPETGYLSLIGAGVCAPITTLCTSFAYLIVLGGAPLFSISLGQKNEKDAKRIFSNAVLALLILSFLVMGVFYLVMKPMLFAFGASEQSYTYAKDYMTYFLIGMPFAFLAIGFTQFLMSQGHSGLSMASTISASLLNIILDPIFLFVIPLGIKGAAIATSISWFFSFLLSLTFILLKAKIKPGFAKYSLRIILRMIRFGVSPFIILASDAIIIIALNAVLQKTGGDKGDFFIECSTIVQAFFSLVTGPLLGISTGTQPVLGYLFGAKRMDLVKKAEKQITVSGLIFTSISFILSFFLAKPFASLFLSFSSSSQDTAEVIAHSVKYIHYYMYPIILLTFQYTLVDGLTGLGRADISLWLSLNRKFVLLLPLTFLIPILSKDASLAFLAEPIADAVSSIVSTIIFLIVFPKILKKGMESSSSALEGL